MDCGALPLVQVAQGETLQAVPVEGDHAARARADSTLSEGAEWQERAVQLESGEPIIKCAKCGTRKCGADFSKTQQKKLVSGPGGMLVVKEP